MLSPGGGKLGEPRAGGIFHEETLGGSKHQAAAFHGLWGKKYGSGVGRAL